MDFVVGFIFIWLVWGVSMLVQNSKDLSIFAARKFPTTRLWHSVVYFPLWGLTCIMLIIIYPPLSIKRIVLNTYDKYFKNNA